MIVPGDGWAAEIKGQANGKTYWDLKPIIFWQEDRDQYVTAFVEDGGRIVPADTVFGFKGFCQITPPVVAVIPANPTHPWFVRRKGSHRVPTPILGWAVRRDGSASPIEAAGDRAGVPIVLDCERAWVEPAGGWPAESETMA